MTKFDFVSTYADAGLPLPKRGTADSAGYDFVVAEDTIVPSYQSNRSAMLMGTAGLLHNTIAYTLDDVAELTKYTHARPTLVPTGVKCYMEPGQYLELSVRSSTPLKHWLILANGVGIIDRDYADNEQNEGHIYFQLINFAPFDIQLRKGDKIGQGIIKRYEVTDDDAADGQRKGGFGSTNG